MSQLKKLEESQNRVIEKRIINSLRRQLEEKEFEIYQQFGKLTEDAKTGDKLSRLNLMTSPDWLDLSK